MDFLELTLPTFADNIALDEALLLTCAAGQTRPVLRVWEWQRPAVVLGAAGIVREEVDQESCIRDAVPLARRSSGGGTVVIGNGCLLVHPDLGLRPGPRAGADRPLYTGTF